jgi:hypothetical protein
MRVLLIGFILLLSTNIFAMPLTWRAGLNFGLEPDSVKERVKAEEESYYRRYEYQNRRTDERNEELKKKLEQETLTKKLEQEAIEKRANELMEIRLKQYSELQDKLEKRAQINKIQGGSNEVQMGERRVS